MSDVDVYELENELRLGTCTSSDSNKYRLLFFFFLVEMEDGDTHRSQHHFNLTISASVAFFQHNQLT